MAKAFTIEAMQEDDIPQVTEIEREAFPTIWPSNAYRRELQNKMARYLVALESADEAEGALDTQAATTIAPQTFTSSESSPSRLNQFVSSFRRLIVNQHQPHPAANHRRVVGFVGMWYMMDEAHITSIAVRESHRRRGIGELLLRSAIQLALELGCQQVTLEVRVSNLAPQALYQKYGFQPTGLRRRYYSDNGEDALVMSTDCITSASYQQMFQRLKQQAAQRMAQALATGEGESACVATEHHQ